MTYAGLRKILPCVFLCVVLNITASNAVCEAINKCIIFLIGRTYTRKTCIWGSSMNEKNTDMSRFFAIHYTEKSGLRIIFEKYTKKRSSQSPQNFGFMIFMIFPTYFSPNIFFCDVFF